MTRFRTMKDLQEALKNAGLPHNKKTIFRWEAEGRLESPRSPTNFKFVKGERYYVRMFTEEQIQEIIKSFSPGGDGYWTYRKEGETSSKRS